MTWWRRLFHRHDPLLARGHRRHERVVLPDVRRATDPPMNAWTSLRRMIRCQERAVERRFDLDCGGLLPAWFVVFAVLALFFLPIFIAIVLVMR